jgi:sulfatase maturation enzyme AslB (radical SAM superfamily)
LTGPEDIRSLYIVLTSRCNLKCTYCYQRQKQGSRISWEVLRAAVELVLRSNVEDCELIFYGGEPLLELPLIRKTVSYVREAHPDRPLRYTVVTNGTLLDREISDFFVAHGFEVQLSFDGVREAQTLRGPNTFMLLDRLVDRLRADYPEWFQKKLCLNITLSAAAVPYLADSFDYLLDKGVQDIGVVPVFTHDDGWRIEEIRALDELFARVYQSSKRHYLRTGHIPLVDFRARTSVSPHKPQGRMMCGVAEGKHLAVDVNGQVSGCVGFIQSYQKKPAPLLDSRLDGMHLGHIESPRFRERLERFSEAVHSVDLFTEKEKKYSSYGRCGDCPCLPSCVVCPLSIGHIPGNTDSGRVSDFQCAYNRISHKYRNRFPRRPDTMDILRGKMMIPELMKELRDKVE